MEEIRIVAISDLHGQLPERLPAADLLLIAGDICPCNYKDTVMGQRSWLMNQFSVWLDKQPVKHVVATWGNHDWIGESTYFVPRLGWHMLVDRGVELLGLKIYGTPHQPRFGNWAFNLDEPQLAEKWAAIPDDTDILVLHGPPHGYGDLAPPINGVRSQMEHVGSPSLTKRIAEIKPRLVVYGHIHSGYGIYSMGETTLVNVSLLDEQYRMVNQPTLITLKGLKGVK